MVIDDRRARPISRVHDRFPASDESFHYLPCLFFLSIIIIFLIYSRERETWNNGISFERKVRKLLPLLFSVDFDKVEGGFGQSDESAGAKEP